MNNIVIDETAATTTDSVFIRREIERLMVTLRYDDAYQLYLSDPSLSQPVSFDQFVAENK